MADLEEAIRIPRQAISATPEDHPDRGRAVKWSRTLAGNRYLRTERGLTLKKPLSSLSRGR